MDNFWEKPNWELEDKHLKAVRQSAFQRSFPVLQPNPGLQSIRGPRQIGKSSWLKTILSHQIRVGKKCFFYSCEELRDFKELSELLKPLRSRDVIILDEISFVSEWDRAVKHLIDSGFDGSLVVTGSNSFDLRQGLDRMPGRWAQGEVNGEHLLLPMEFDEWMSMRRQAGWKTSHELVENLTAFFKIGGFPTCLAEAGPELREPVHSKQTYHRWLVGDVRRKDRQEVFLRKLLGQLALTLTTPLSVQKLAQKTQMMSHHTAQEYLTILEDCFAVRTLYCMDPETGAIRFKKEKKFYFTDPILFWISMEWAGHPIPENWAEKLAEQVAHEFLARRAKRLGYFSSGKGEVDFFDPKRWAIEVKWASVPRNISRAYFDLLIPRKVVWSQSNFLTDLPETL